MESLADMQKKLNDLEIRVNAIEAEAPKEIQSAEDIRSYVEYLFDETDNAELKRLTRKLAFHGRRLRERLERINKVERVREELEAMSIGGKKPVEKDGKIFFTIDPEGSGPKNWADTKRKIGYRKKNSGT